MNHGLRDGKMWQPDVFLRKNRVNILVYVVELNRQYDSLLISSILMYSKRFHREEGKFLLYEGFL